uniref:BTB/POZ domain-containing protein At5g47800 n=1 Tax=Anthurium amnicola TaxID=1678845 RepID=A0A1D1Z9V3_9ARAE
MKYMKLGTRPDTFYTEEATRSVLSDVPSDLVIQINSIIYRLHKFPLLLKCGLLQRLCSNDSDDAAEASPVELHDMPGGEKAFELCAKFSYGIAINLSAHNFIPAVCGARFLRMTESVAQGNFLVKLEAFFDTCILHGWKDSVVTLQATRRLTGWSENLGIVHRCVDAVVGKILTHPSKVSWSYTYTRPGYAGKQHRSVPRDWWTEDVSELDLDHFRTIISSLRSAKEIPPPLIGEALHVYACKHLPDPSAPPESSEATPGETPTKERRRILESIVGMIPVEPGSVSGGFLLRLLRVATLVGASPSTRAELVRRSGRQLHEAGVEDLLLFPSPSGGAGAHDVELVEAVVEHFLAQFRRPAPEGVAGDAGAAMRRVARAIDSYLQVVARCAGTPVSKFADLAGALPEVARPEHDGLYRAIDTYLKEHPDLSKEEKRQLCRMIDCRKLSSDARSHAIGNERLPLRTIVQLLFVEQEKAAGAGGSHGSPRSDAAGDGDNVLRSTVVDGHAKPAWGADQQEANQTEQQDRRERTGALGRARSVAGRMGKSRSAKKEVEITEDGGLGNRVRRRS